MSEAKAQLNNYRQSPRKVRVVADLVRGKSVEEAKTLLDFAPRRASLPLKKLLQSAISNAKDKDNLVVRSIRVDAGPTLFRRRSRSHGMANPIRKRTSHVTLVLGQKNKK